MRIAQKGQARCSGHSFSWSTVILVMLGFVAITLDVRALAANAEKGDKASKPSKTEKAEKGEKKEAAPVVGRVIPNPMYPPYSPSMRDKNEDAVHNYIVDFEAAYAKAEPNFAVDEFTKHDYEACAKSVEPMEKAAKGLAKVHDERLRQYGNNYHHDLEALASTLQQLHVAVKEHRRSDIFTYWAQLKMQRDALSMTSAWQDETTTWPPAPPKDKKKKD